MGWLWCWGNKTYQHWGCTSLPVAQCSKDRRRRGTRWSHKQPGSPLHWKDWVSDGWIKRIEGGISEYLVDIIYPPVWLSSALWLRVTTYQRYSSQSGLGLGRPQLGLWSSPGRSPQVECLTRGRSSPPSLLSHSSVLNTLVIRGFLKKGGIHQGLSLDTHVMRTAHIGPR